MPDEPRKRTFDERLDAVIQTLELVAGMQQVNEREIERIGREIDRVNIAIDKDAENIRALVRVVEMHQHLIDDHDQRIDKIEEQ